MKKSVLLILMSAVLLPSFSLCAETTEKKEEIKSPPFRRPVISPVVFDEVVNALKMGPQTTVTIGDDEYAVLDDLPRLKSKIDNNELGFELFKRDQIRSLPGSGVKWIYAGVERVDPTEGSYLTIHFTQDGGNSSNHTWHQGHNGSAVASSRTVNFLLKKI